LNSDDLRIFKCGYITLLPNDKKGRGVLSCDASRLEKDCQESRLRCLFYMLHVAAESASKKEGVAILLVMNKLSFERTREHSSLTQLLQAFPVKLAAVHIVRQPARLGARFFDEKVVPSLTSLFLPVNAPLHVHSGNPSCDLRKELSQYGFDAENLPRSLGGGWTYQDFLQWRELRLAIEGTSSLKLEPKSSQGAQSVPDQNCAAAVVPLVNATPQAQRLSRTLAEAQASPGCMLHNAFAGRDVQMEKQALGHSLSNLHDEQRRLQLLELSRLQQVASLGHVDALTVEWLQGRADYLAASMQPQRSGTEAAIGTSQDPTLTTQILLNRLVNSVQGSSVTGGQMEESDPLNF
jgi:Divergent CRAL/TRIO domain